MEKTDVQKRDREFPMFIKLAMQIFPDILELYWRIFTFY